MLTKEKVEEIAKDLKKEVLSILKFHNLDISQVKVKFGDGVDIEFKLNCNYLPENENDFYLPDSSEFHDGTAPLPALGTIVEDKQRIPVQVLSKTNKKYRIKKDNDYFTVPFDEVFINK